MNLEAAIIVAAVMLIILTYNREGYSNYYSPYNPTLKRNHAGYYTSHIGYSPSSYFPPVATRYYPMR